MSVPLQRDTHDPRFKRNSLVGSSDVGACIAVVAQV